MRVTPSLAASVAAALFAVLPVAVQAAPITFTAPLTVGQEVPPPNIPPGINVPTGTGTATFDPDTRLIFGTLTWSNTTSNVTRGHIHVIAPPGQTGGIVVPFFDNASFPTTSSFTLNPTTLTENVAAQLLSGLTAGLAYFNVHTVLNPPGEIRGDIRPIGAVPLPATFGLLAIGLLGAGVNARRVRRG